MATLYLGRRRGAAGFSRSVAIKVVHPHLSEDERFVSMFVDEALLCSRMDHPNVVRVDELAEKDGHYYLVMEYVQGCSLATFSRVVQQTHRRIAPELAVAIALRVAAGLDAAHELVLDDGRPAGVVHRDVTPSNVLLGFRGEVKLIDFGIAKAADRANATRTGTLKGKVAYMSPEQAFGREVDRRTDIYALGILLWEMITMRRLFSGGNDLAILERVRKPQVTPPSYYAPDIPRDLDRVIMRALSSDPSARPATARELRELLVNALPQALMLDAPQIAAVVRVVLADGNESDRVSIPSSMESMPIGDEASSSIVSQLILPRTDPGHEPAPSTAEHTAVPSTLLAASPMDFVDAPESTSARWPVFVAIGIALLALVGGGVLGALSLTRADHGEMDVTELEPTRPRPPAPAEASDAPAEPRVAQPPPVVLAEPVQTVAPDEADAQPESARPRATRPRRSTMRVRQPVVRPESATPPPPPRMRRDMRLIVDDLEF